MPRLPERLFLSTLQTPLGDGLIVFDADGALRVFDWTSHTERMHRLLRRQNGTVDLVDATAPLPIQGAFADYFAGDISALGALACRTGGTAFQRDVWAELRRIPAGLTISYRQLAERIGRPAAVRAVGLANGANPLGIVVPCHRVIGADRSLTGYGGGLDRKRWLLAHEGADFKDDAA